MGEKRHPSTMAAIGATGDTSKATDAAVTVGTYLKNLGFNLDFAPVADIASTTSSALARRSFGADAATVAPMVRAQVGGYLSTGILCCAKHFPGIGGAEGDSEKELVYTHSTLDEMKTSELLPFEAVIDAGVPMIMSGIIPGFLRGLFVFQTPFDGAFRGDFAILAMMCLVADWVFCRIASSLR